MCFCVLGSGCGQAPRKCGISAEVVELPESGAYGCRVMSCTDMETRLLYVYCSVLTIYRWPAEPGRCLCCGFVADLLGRCFGLVFALRYACWVRDCTPGW